MGILFILFSIYYILAAAFAVYFVTIKLYRDVPYTREVEPNLKNEWKPWQRTDRAKWNIYEIYFGAVFLFPIRLLLILVSMSVLSIIFQLFVNITLKSSSLQFNPVRRQLVRCVCSITAYIVLFAHGFYYIPKKQLRIQDFDPKYADFLLSKPRNTFQKAPIIITNHSSWIDIIYITALITPSFLSKFPISKVPLLGTAAKAMQCVFLKREDENDREAVMNSILQRTSQIKEGQNLPPILIFPEGTTTNGRYLISFKKGAFEPLQPLQIICLQYEHKNFSPTLDLIGNDVAAVLTMCHLRNEMSSYQFDTLYPDYLNVKTVDDWSVLSNYSQNLMNQVLQITPCEYGYRNLLQYKNYLIEKYNLEDNSKKQEKKRE